MPYLSGSSNGEGIVWELSEEGAGALWSVPAAGSATVAVQGGNHICYLQTCLSWQCMKNDAVGRGLRDQEVLWHSFVFNLFSLISSLCRNRSQTVSSETSVDESGVFESLKAETSSPQQLFSGLAGIPSGSITAAPFQSGLVLGSSAGGGEVFIQMPAPREEGAGRTEGAPFHHRQQPHHFHHGHHRGSALLHMAGGDRHGHAEEGSEEQAGTPAPALSELKAVVGWLQKGLPFILILLAKVCFQHKLGKRLSFGDCKWTGGWLLSSALLWCLTRLSPWQHLQVFGTKGTY